jgi:hypothetical protein
VDEIMVCRSGNYDRNNKLQPAIFYHSSGNIDEIILARAMGFSWDCERFTERTFRYRYGETSNIKVRLFQLDIFK